VETEVGGFALMELISGWERVILVDSIQFDKVEPGTVIRIKPEDLHTSLRLRSVTTSICRPSSILGGSLV